MMSQTVKDKELSLIKQAQSIQLWEDARRFIEELPHLMWKVIDRPDLFSYYEESTVPTISLDLTTAIIEMHDRLKARNPPVSYDSIIWRYLQFLGEFLASFPTRQICEATWRWLLSSPGPDVDASEWSPLVSAIYDQWHLPTIWKLGIAGQDLPPTKWTRLAWDFAEVATKFCYCVEGDWIIRGAILWAAGKLPDYVSKQVLGEFVDLQYPWTLAWIFHCFPEDFPPDMVYRSVYMLVYYGKWNPFHFPEFERLQKGNDYYDKDKHRQQLFVENLEEYKRAWQETRAMQVSGDYFRLPELLESLPNLGLHVHVLAEVAGEKLPPSVLDYLAGRVWRLKEDIRLKESTLDGHPDHPDQELSFRKLCVSMLAARGDYRPRKRAEEICKQYITGKLPS